MYAYIDSHAFKTSKYESVKEFLYNYGTIKLLGRPPKTDVNSYVQLQPGWSVRYRLKK